MALKEMQIPTIDFSNLDLKPGTTQWGKTKIQVLQALQEYGCFIAIFDKVSKETREAMFSISKEIFEFPLETKQKNLSTTNNPLEGYKGQFLEIPSYESLCIADLLKPQSVETFANIFWPDENLDFCNVFKSYSTPLVELDEMVKRMVLESLGLKDYINEFLDPNIFNCRISHYKAVQGEDKNSLGLHDHTDSGFLTIISQNQVNGLQVLQKNGDQWIDINIAPNSFFVLSGDSFMAWTNGQLHSPIHKVTMANDSDRFSIPIFSIPKPGHTIKAPNELVDEDHPLLFKPYDILGLFKYLESEAGLRAGGGAFKAYCAV